MVVDVASAEEALMVIEAVTDRCLKQPVVTVVKNARYPFNLQEENLFIVMTVLEQWEALIQDALTIEAQEGQILIMEVEAHLNLSIENSLRC
ncbi:hypothetical protein A2957_00045 [Candidatus Roizmanbacteria bacterium RIFCSPLOWO2_01_FULL_38_11]|uniref:Uncharacterized protein n=1 Tax=Candidatus Roizmanbacteria bacterium RIFCSPLOWO2_01_FULL_38_11 TaxID=1802060 RepID=A0A1F7IN12_9BACT|nr:MAG: hypothetical protein A2957_00045 [Candidatus Roizmanbacteria bacterium RIFCSPLOWO2_01_FULL_38_11]